MNKMIQKFVFGLLILAAPLAHAEIVERIVAIVNSELVLESDIRDLQKKLNKPELLDDSLLLGKPVDSLKGDRKAQLSYLINQRLIESEIKRLNLTVTFDRVDAELKDKAKANNISVEELLNAIKAQGVDEADYKKFLKERIEKQSLMDTEIISKLRISDEDALSEYLHENPSSKSSINEFSVAHIFFNPRKGGAQAAYERAQAALEKLRAGESFEALAEQYSEDPNFTAGGSLGSFKAGEFLPEIESSIQSIGIGETTPIVKSKMGYHIVKLLSKKVTTDPRFERDKERIKAQILETSFKRQLKLWMDAKKDDSFIRINE